MKLDKEYTTESLKLKDAVKEKDKIVISEEAFVVASFLEKLLNTIKRRGKI